MASALIGRRAELAVLEAALDALDAGRPAGVVQVVGEPGIGKSALLGELAARAEARHHLLLAGRAAEFERDVPFGVFVNAVDDYLASLELPALPGLGTYPGELAAVFPALASGAAHHPPVLPAERYRTYRAVRALLESLAANHPLVLALDDVHWADPGSVELLCHLLAHPPQAPVLVVVAFRPAQLPPELAVALVSVAQEDPTRRLELSPLDRGEAEELLGSRGDESWMADLYRQSGGNPFYLQQLSRGPMPEASPVEPALLDLAGRGVPPLVRAALAAELKALPVPARLLLQGAAVAGDPFDDPMAAEAAAMDEAEALPLLDLLVERDLVRPTSVPRRFRFRHPLVRRAVYELAGAGWRLAGHARLATALAARGTPAAALAHHVERSARPGDETAMATLVEAAEATAPRAPAIAAHWYQAALRLLPDGPGHDGRRLELLVARATALGAAGRLEESRAALTQALERLAPGTSRRTRVVTACAAVELALGRFEHTGGRLRAALDELEDGHSAEAVALKVELAACAVYSNNFTEARQWAEEVAAGARSLGDRTLEALGAALMGYAHYTVGETAPAGQHLDHAAAIFEALDDAAVARRLDIVLWLGWAEAWMERFDDAVRHCERAIAVSRATGQGQFLVTTMNAEVWALLWRGRLAEAMEVASASAESSRLAAHGFLWEAVGFHAMAASYAGDHDTALRLAGECVELARSLDPGLLTATARLPLAVVLVEAGEPERARAELLEAGGGPGLPLIGLRGVRGLACETLCRAELALGRPDAADEWARRAEAVAADGELPVEAGLARRARAAVLLATGRPAEAAEVALQAARATAMVSPLEAGRSRLLAGRGLAQARQPERAVAELERGEQELAVCGARGYVDQTRRELHRLGRRGPRPRRAESVAGLGSLSQREREIAELVAEGRTNREIASRCYLAEKTVERHLSHVFTKLGVTTGRLVAAAVARKRQQAPMSGPGTLSPGTPPRPVAAAPPRSTAPRPPCRRSATLTARPSECSPTRR